LWQFGDQHAQKGSSVYDKVCCVVLCVEAGKKISKGIKNKKKLANVSIKRYQQHGQQLAFIGPFSQSQMKPSPGLKHNLNGRPPFKCFSVQYLA
jgi:hypothetical protein